MSYIYLLPNGFHVKDDDGGYVKVDKINRWLQSYIKIGVDNETITFGDFFNALMEYEKDIDFLFESYTKGFYLKPFYDEMCDAPSDDTPLGLNIDYVIVSWGTDYYEYEDDDLNIVKDFSMFVNISCVDNSPSGCGESSFSLCKLSDLKDVRIVLNNNHQTTHFVVDAEKNTGGYIKIFDANTDMTLQNFIGGILHEMTFFGSPQHKIEFLNEMKTEMDTVNEQKDKITDDKFQLQWLEQDLIRLSNEEKYEKAAKVKKKIDELKVKIQNRLGNDSDQ